MTGTTLRIDGEHESMDALLADSTARRSVEEQLPGYLREQRWFGGKTREITGTRIAHWVPLGGAVDACLCIVAVEDASGRKTEHQMHLAREGSRIIDALELGPVRARMLELLSNDCTTEGHDLTLVVETVSPVSCAGGEGKTLGADQSNTSLVFDDECLIKVYRRLERGPNPDVELSRYLGASAHFEGVPAFLATATAHFDGARLDLIALQAWVPSDGDAWGWATGMCRRIMAADEPVVSLLDAEDALSLAGALGRTTAELHEALARATEPGMAPAEPVQDDIDDWLATLAEESEALLANDAVTGELRDAIAAIREVKLGSPAECGLKIRIHGDYHLGQVLKQGDRFTILDFEGEPSRPIRERRALQSPLVDIAGMVRSWDYAARACGLDAGSEAERRRALEWGAAMSSRFLDGYWDAAARAEVSLLPSSEAVRDTLLHLFELRKALYEVRYELNNRPDWAAIPGAAVIRLVEALR